jgi:hypothetical protein
VIIMLSTPVMSRVRPAALVSGGAAMVCLAGAWLTPISANTAHPTSASPPSAATSSASGATVRPIADVTSLRSAWPAAGGPGSGPGGGSDGSPGNAVAPSPAKHESNGGSSSSGSGGSVSSHASSSHDSGPVGAVFKTVGRWFGLSADRSPASGDSAEGAHPAAAPHADRASGASGASDQDPTAAAPKQVKPSSASGAAGDDKSSKTSAAAGIGDVIHRVFSGVGRLFSSLFGR